MKIWRFLFFGVLLSQSLSFGQDKTQTANGLQLAGAFTPVRAMTAVYGSYDYVGGVLKWKPTRTKSYSQYWPDAVNVSLLLDAPYVELGIPKHLLVTSAIPKEGDQSEFTCHSCGVLIGLILFAKNREGWRVEASDLQFGVYGEFGHPPAVSVQPLGPHRFGLMIPESFGAQGAVSDSVTITLPKGGKFLTAFKANTAASWSDQFCPGEGTYGGAENCVAYDGSVDIVPAATAKSEYYDILLTKRVFRTLSKSVPEGTSAIRYRFDGSKYVPQTAGK